MGSPEKPQARLQAIQRAFQPPSVLPQHTHGKLSSLKRRKASGGVAFGSLEAQEKQILYLHEINFRFRSSAASLWLEMNERQS